MKGRSKAEQRQRWNDFLEKNPPLPKEEQRRRWDEQAAILRKDEQALVEALTAAGWPERVRQCGEARSVWDLVNTAEPYPHLLGTLVEHIVKPYHKRTREGIARALAVLEARGTEIPRVLLDELKKEVDPNDGPNSYRWALINTLVSIGDSSLRDEVLQLVDDPRYASVRLDLLRIAKRLSQRADVD